MPFNWLAYFCYIRNNSSQDFGFLYKVERLVDKSIQTASIILKIKYFALVKTCIITWQLLWVFFSKTPNSPQKSFSSTQWIVLSKWIFVFTFYVYHIIFCSLIIDPGSNHWYRLYNTALCHWFRRFIGQTQLLQVRNRSCILKEKTDYWMSDISTFYMQKLFFVRKI